MHTATQSPAALAYLVAVARLALLRAALRTAQGATAATVSPRYGKSYSALAVAHLELYCRPRTGSTIAREARIFVASDVSHFTGAIRYAEGHVELARKCLPLPVRVVTPAEHAAKLAELDAAEAALERSQHADGYGDWRDGTSASRRTIASVRRELAAMQVAA